MMGNVVIRAPKYGHEKIFDHPRKAYEFVALWQENKMPMDALEIENNSGVSLSAYNPRIPRDAQELIEKLEQHYGGNTIVPEWHWLIKPRNYWTTGRSWYGRKTGKTTHVTISSNNRNPNDYLGVVIHEFIHAVLPRDEHHGRTFYRAFFEKLHEFASAECIKWTVKREFEYVKSSRYWFAEMYNVESILAEYHRPSYAAARKPTKEEKIASTANLIFGEGEE